MIKLVITYLDSFNTMRDDFCMKITTFSIIITKTRSYF